MKIFLTVLLFLAGAVLIISLVSPYYLVASFYDSIRLRDYSIAQNFLSPDFESNLNRRIQKTCKMSESQGDVYAHKLLEPSRFFRLFDNSISKTSGAEKNVGISRDVFDAHWDVQYKDINTFEVTVQGSTFLLFRSNVLYWSITDVLIPSEWCKSKFNF